MKQILILVVAMMVTITLCARKRPKAPASLTRRSLECILLESNDTVAATEGVSTYAQIENIDVKEGLRVYMEVFPSPNNHNGVLFSVGTIPSFPYFGWNDPTVQFMVLEFTHSSLALTLRAPNGRVVESTEISRTYPVPYNLRDAKWFSVKVNRTGSKWILHLDSLTKSQDITTATNVTFSDKPAFIGGRPGYTAYQFQGIIRNFRINGLLVSPKNMSNSYVSKLPCRDARVTAFRSWAKGSTE